MEKLNNFKCNIKATIGKIKENLKKIYNYIKEKYNKHVFAIQFIVNIVLIISLICSLIMTKNLYKQLNDISNRVDTTISNINSQTATEEVEAETVEPETEPEPEAEPEADSEPIEEPTSTQSTITTDSAPTTPSSTEPSSAVIAHSTSDIDLLACVIYQEAGGNGSCDECRRRVADVVLNRVEDPRFPNTINEVLTARNQYGKFHYTGVVWPSRASKATEQDAVARAYRIAEEVLNGQHSELYGNGYIWQAGFRQGSSQIKCCGTYFGK